MASNLVQDVSDAQFAQQVLQSNKLTLVDFWAEWCGPCKAIAPIVNDIATAYEGKLNVMKMNIDDNPETPNQFQIKGIPTLILFKDGQMIDQIVGAVPKDRLETMLKKHVQSLSYKIKRDALGGRIERRCRASLFIFQAILAFWNGYSRQTVKKTKILCNLTTADVQKDAEFEKRANNGCTPVT